MEKYDFIKQIEGKNELVGRREELALLKESMFKKRMKNTILVGAAGCGKTAILEQFAYDMSHHFNLVELDIGACVAGTSLRGQFEEKLINFLSVTAKMNNESSKKTIIFIDEIHTLYNAGGCDGALDASNIIKSYLSRGEITIIGATTLEEYNKTIAKDKALNRRLSPLFLKELDDESNLTPVKIGFLSFLQTYKLAFVKISIFTLTQTLSSSIFILKKLSVINLLVNLPFFPLIMKLLSVIEISAGLKALTISRALLLTQKSCLISNPSSSTMITSLLLTTSLE